jgi:hypothetical protein
MKKLALTSILALGMTGAVFAQGEINWGSISFTFFTAQTNTTQLSPWPHLMVGWIRGWKA